MSVRIWSDSYLGRYSVPFKLYNVNNTMNLDKNGPLSFSIADLGTYPNSKDFGEKLRKFTADNILRNPRVLLKLASGKVLILKLMCADSNHNYGRGIARFYPSYDPNSKQDLLRYENAYLMCKDNNMKSLDVEYSIDNL